MSASFVEAAGAAFVTSESGGPDNLYQLVFKFRSLKELHAAHTAWAEQFTPAVPDSSAAGSAEPFAWVPTKLDSIGEVQVLWEKATISKFVADRDFQDIADATVVELYLSTPPAASGSAEPVATASVYEYCADDRGEVRGACWNDACISWKTGFLQTKKPGEKIDLYAGAPPSQQAGDKHWCETCEGTGSVHQEHQAGCHVGGDYPCPDCDGKGYWIPRASVSAKDAEPVADMFWNYADAEKQHESIDEFLNDEICNGMLEVGAEFTILRGVRLPRIKIRVTSIDEEQCEADYEVITPAASKGAA